MDNTGILVINKPKDLTSRDVVNIVSKKLQTKKIGHTGTLDPLATGVLVLVIEKATKLNELLTSEYKEYIATCTFGINTDTLDITGKILNKEKIKIKQKKIENILKTFTTYNQEVPIYSAVKVNGKKLYEYARNNEKVELPKKEVTIKKIELLEYVNEENTKIKFKCLVSKGTYIRSLIRDIGKKLNTYATMTDLERTKQGNFSIENSYTLEDIENDNYKILKIRDVLEIKQEKVDDNLKKQILNGVKQENKNKILYLDKNNNELAIYDNGKVYRMLQTNN